MASNICSNSGNNKVKNLLQDKNIKKLAKSKKPDFLKSKNITRLNFFTTKAKLTFTKLRQAFIKVLIFYYFGPKYYI